MTHLTELKLFLICVIILFFFNVRLQLLYKLFLLSDLRVIQIKLLRFILKIVTLKEKLDNVLFHIFFCLIFSSFYSYLINTPKTQ